MCLATLPFPRYRLIAPLLPEITQKRGNFRILNTLQPQELSQPVVFDSDLAGGLLHLKRGLHAALLILADLALEILEVGFVALTGATLIVTNAGCGAFGRGVLDKLVMGVTGFQVMMLTFGSLMSDILDAVPVSPKCFFIANGVDTPQIGPVKTV